MIHVFYTYCNKEWSEDTARLFMKGFSEAEILNLARSKRWKDRQAKIIGRKLLLHGLENIQLTPRDVIIKYTKYQKPYLLEGPFFNISHSEDYVVCAISENMEIGIDIEKKRKIRIPDVSSAFTDKENTIIKKDSNNLYGFWTRKEAIIKAEGSGLLNKLNAIETSEDESCLMGKIYITKEIAIDPDYACHIAYRL